MIKLKKLLTEGDISKSWWMDPNGRLHRVPHEGHHNFASYMVSVLMKNAPRPKYVYNAMYDMGWLRVVLYGYMGQNRIEINLNVGEDPSSTQMSALKELAEMNDVVEIFDSANNKRYPIYHWE
jgi:hypothetical protein